MGLARREDIPILLLSSGMIPGGIKASHAMMGTKVGPMMKEGPVDTVVTSLLAAAPATIIMLYL